MSASIYFILAVLAIADIFLIFLVLILSRRSTVSQNLVSEMGEERALLEELKAQIRDDLEQTRQDIQAARDKVQLIASEIDSDIKSYSSALQKEADEVFTKLSEQVEAPLEELKQHQTKIAKYHKILDRKISVLQRIVSRGEQVVRFHQGQLTYEQLMQELLS